jgi:heme/copper-type cytochrome/quinol oxidase subunit 3
MDNKDWTMLSGVIMTIFFLLINFHMIFIYPSIVFMIITFVFAIRVGLKDTPNVQDTNSSSNLNKESLE